MRNQYKVLAERYEQVNEIGFAPGVGPRENPKNIIKIKDAIWTAVTSAADEQEMLALPNGQVVEIYEIYKALKKAKTFEDVEKVFFDYGLDYFIHSNPE